MTQTEEPLAVAVDKFDLRARERILAELRVLRNWKAYEVAALDELGMRVKQGLTTPTDAADLIEDWFGTSTTKQEAA
jgi:hypothetical protein